MPVCTPALTKDTVIGRQFGRFRGGGVMQRTGASPTEPINHTTPTRTRLNFRRGVVRPFLSVALIRGSRTSSVAARWHDRPVPAVSNAPFRHVCDCACGRCWHAHTQKARRGLEGGGGGPWLGARGNGIRCVCRVMQGQRAVARRVARASQSLTPGDAASVPGSGTGLNDTGKLSTHC